MKAAATARAQLLERTYDSFATLAASMDADEMRQARNAFKR
jgi:hypothetical protein